MTTRRDFLQTLAAGGVLCLGVSLGGCGGASRARIARADQTGELDANLYITVLPSGRVRLTVDKTELGQGVTTGYATLVAEELEVAPGDIDVVLADSLPQYKRAVPDLPMVSLHFTGGSMSMMLGWTRVREAAAAAREMLVAAAAAQWQVRASTCRATQGHVVAADGRRLGYGALTRLAAHHAPPDAPRLKAPKDFQVIGKHDARIDVTERVTGRVRYGIDAHVEGMARATLIVGPELGARAARIDAVEARRMPGVVDIFAVPGGVAVVAEKLWQARAAAARTRVTWTHGASHGLDTAELADAARRYRGEGAVVEARGSGEVEGEVLEAVYEAPHLAHAPLEPQNCIADVRGRRVEIWTSCQVPTVVQIAVADALDLDPDDVLVHPLPAGGAFGRRLLGDVAAQAATIARRIKRPVHLIWSRETDMASGYYRPMATARLRGTVQGGRIAALGCHVISQPITHDQGETTRGGMPGVMPAFLKGVMAHSVSALTAANTSLDMFATEGVAHTPYRVPDARFAFTPVQTKIPVGFWRSVGHSYNGFFMEGFLDELAARAKVDPYDFRRAMLAPGSRELRVLDAACALADWRRPAATGFAKGLARHTAFGTEVAQVAEAGVVAGRIRVTKVWCAVECGIAVNPDIVRAQIEGAIIFGLGAALDQQITLRDGVLVERNYDTFPLLRMHECPEITVTIVPSTAKPSGVGEPGLPPIAPAVANAIARQTGVRLRTLPLQLAWNRGGR